MNTLKKFFAAFALLLISTVTAQAQSFSYGIVAGFDLSKMQLSGTAKENFSSDNKAGWYVGPKVAFNTLLGFGFDASLQYSQRDLTLVGEDTYGYEISETEKYRTIEIPINIRYNIGLGKVAGVFFYTGPQFGFALNNMKWSNLGTGTNFEKENMNTTWNIGAGVRLLKHLEASIGYNFALGKAGKAIFSNWNGTSTDRELKYKTNTFQVQVAYMF